MSLSSKFRWVYVGKISLRKENNAPDGAPDFVIDDLFEALEECSGKMCGKRLFYNNEKLMWCSNVKKYNNYIVFLVQSGDKNASDPAFVDFNTSIVRSVSKENDEGQHFCSHILISQDFDKSGRHRIFVEKVPGINFTSLRAQFNFVFKNDKFMKIHSGKEYRCLVEIDGFQSNTLREAMIGGIVQDIKFIGTQKADFGLDEVDVIREVTMDVCWDIRARLDGNAATKLLTKAIDFMSGWGGD